MEETQKVSFTSTSLWIPFISFSLDITGFFLSQTHFPLRFLRVHSLISNESE